MSDQLRQLLKYAVVAVALVVGLFPIVFHEAIPTGVLVAGAFLFTGLNLVVEVLKRRS